MSTLERKWTNLEDEIALVSIGVELCFTIISIILLHPLGAVFQSLALLSSVLTFKTNNVILSTISGILHFPCAIIFLLASVDNLNIFGESLNYPQIRSIFIWQCVANFIFVIIDIYRCRRFYLDGKYTFTKKLLDTSIITTNNESPQEKEASYVSRKKNVEDSPITKREFNLSLEEQQSSIEKMEQGEKVITNTNLNNNIWVARNAMPIGRPLDLQQIQLNDSNTNDEYVPSRILASFPNQKLREILKSIVPSPPSLLLSQIKKSMDKSDATNNEKDIEQWNISNQLYSILYNSQASNYVENNNNVNETMQSNFIYNVLIDEKNKSGTNLNDHITDKHINKCLEKKIEKSLSDEEKEKYETENSEIRNETLAEEESKRETLIDMLERNDDIKILLNNSYSDNYNTDINLSNNDDILVKITNILLNNNNNSQINTSQKDKSCKEFKESIIDESHNNDERKQYENNRRQLIKEQKCESLEDVYCNNIRSQSPSWVHQISRSRSPSITVPFPASKKEYYTSRLSVSSSLKNLNDMDEIVDEKKTSKIKDTQISHVSERGFSFSTTNNRNQKKRNSAASSIIIEPALNEMSKIEKKAIGCSNFSVEK